MESFCVIATPKWKGKGFVACELRFEGASVKEAMRIFRDGTMQKVIVVNDALEIIYKQERKCKCTNVQVTMLNDSSLVDKCCDCGLVINYEGWRRNLPVEAPVEEEAVVG